MGKTYKNCQSCGMPLKQDPAGGGTEADGGRSSMYCSYCYSNGTFAQPDMTMEDMKTLVKEQLVKMKFPKFLAGIFTSGIPKLERWKQG